MNGNYLKWSHSRNKCGRQQIRDASKIINICRGMDARVRIDHQSNFFLWCDCVNWAHINEMSFVKKSYKRESAKTHAYKVIIWLCARQRVNYDYDFHSQSSNINRLKMQRIWAKYTQNTIQTANLRNSWIKKTHRVYDFTVFRMTGLNEIEDKAFILSDRQRISYAIRFTPPPPPSPIFSLSISPLCNKPLWSLTVLDLISHSTANIQMDNKNNNKLNGFAIRCVLFWLWLSFAMFCVFSIFFNCCLI